MHTGLHCTKACKQLESCHWMVCWSFSKTPDFLRAATCLRHFAASPIFPSFPRFLLGDLGSPKLRKRAILPSVNGSSIFDPLSPNVTSDGVTCSAARAGEHGEQRPVSVLSVFMVKRIRLKRATTLLSVHKPWPVPRVQRATGRKTTCTHVHHLHFANVTLADCS